MKSMTGYGKSTVTEGNRQLTVEIKTVNNRYLEIGCRMPKVLSFAEDTVKRTIRKFFNRGIAEVYVVYANSGSTHRVKTDEKLAGAYVEAAKSLSEKYGVGPIVAATDLMRLPDVLSLENDDEDEALLLSMAERATEAAAKAVLVMREAEGEALKADLLKIIGNIDSALAEVEERAPKVVEAYAEKIRARIDEMLGDVAIDEGRLLNEVAFFADKADVNEEINRLHSHISQFTKALDSDAPQGRNLDFLSQEIGREINTIGSKCNDSELTNLVIYMKNELEKIKEQIRNAE